MLRRLLSFGKKNQKEILAFLGIIILFFATRLVVLGNLPIFTDEALYVRWTQIAANDPAWRFISLTDGKQPMLIWLGMIALKLVEDPLIAVRLVSVFAGFSTLIGLFLLTNELFKNKIAALLTSLLYVFFPFAVVYDRMALYDSLVGAFSVFAAYFSILLVRHLRLDIAYTLGGILAGGMLTKTSANFSILLLPLTLILFNFRQKNWFKNLVRWGMLALLSVVIAEVAYNLLRLSPFFHIIKEKNSIFVYYPFSIPIQDNIALFYGNFRGLVHWLTTYLTPSYIILIAVSLLTFFKFKKEKLLLLGYFFFPFIALALFGRVIFPRFVFFMSLYLLPLASLGILEIIQWADKFAKERKLRISYVIASLIVIMFLLYPSKVSLDFIFNPSEAKIADADQRQYITQWPAGGGVRESIEFFKDKAKDEKIFIGTAGSFGLLPYSLEIYLSENKNITIKGYWPIEEVPQEVLEISKKMPTYFIFYQPCIACEYPGDPPDNWPLKLVSRFEKSYGQYYSVYILQN